MRTLMPYVLTFECVFFCLTQGLTLDERNELFRKFKYYFASVRPNPAPNRITNINGTFFALRTELHLISTVPHNRQLNLELFFMMNFVDDRLILRELEHRLKMPSEFQPWLPDLTVYPTIPWKVAVYLDPRSGVITAFYKLQSTLPCTSEKWRHPFEVFYCDLTLWNNGDERILLQNVRDLRSNYQIGRVPFSSGNWPQLVLHFSFAHKWHFALVSSLVPSLLLFCVVVFAQWKRRKIQVIVTVTALICIVIMQSAHRSDTVVTLEDLWLSSTLLHVVLVLLVDLTLPARLIRYRLVTDDTCTSKSSTGNGVLVDMRRMKVEQRLARSGSMETFVEADVIDEDQHSSQYRRTRISMGKRKRIALTSIVMCYVTFLIAYLCFVASFMT